jgi:hypothetical protein
MKRAALSILILLLLFTSCKLKESESSSVVSPTATTMKVTLPNGGESVKEGSSYDIKWTSDAESLVRIQYTVDNGSTWSMLADSLSNTGTYAWFPVPNLISSQCKIRVATIDGTVSDESDAVFSIARNNNQSLMVKTPNGSESWEAGTQKQIVWYSSGIDSVKIEYTTDNGNHWNTIGTDKKNTGVYYWSPVSNTPSSMAKVRISDASDGTPVDESDNVFNILPEPKLTVSAPTGGESWYSGTSQKIQWISENIRNVKIQYTTNGGADWTTIIESTPSIGSYTWSGLPAVNSSLCAIKIMDADDGQPFAVSSNFSISNKLVKSLQLTSPNGGESYEVGTSKQITWTFTNVAYVNVLLSTNNGTSWGTIGNRLTNTGSMAWTIPNEVSSACKIKIIDSDDETIYDESDSYFEIKPTKSITVTYPNGNEVLRAGEKVTIRWNSTSVNFVRIDYTTSNAYSEVGWYELAAKVASSGSFEASFTVPSNEYKIRITDAEDGAVRDESDGTFKVLPQTSITVISPNGGEHLLAGETYEIRWTSVNVARVRIEYTIDGEVSWNTAAVDLVNNGSYLWKVPTVPLSFSDLCKIRISEYDASNPVLSGAASMSAAIFTIHSTKYLRLLSPVGGETWDVTKGDIAYRIQWNSAGIANVNIEYTLDAGVTWQTVVNNIPSTGAYYFLPPQIPSSNALIRIYDASDPSIRDESKSFFNLIFSN